MGCKSVNDVPGIFKTELKKDLVGTSILTLVWFEVLEVEVSIRKVRKGYQKSLFALVELQGVPKGFGTFLCSVLVLHNIPSVSGRLDGELNSPYRRHI